MEPVSSGLIGELYGPEGGRIETSPRKHGYLKSLLYAVPVALALAGCVDGDKRLVKPVKRNPPRNYAQLLQKYEEHVVERDVYEFADTLSRKIPAGFTRKVSGNEFTWHDESLHVGEGPFGWIGKGRYVYASPESVCLTIWDSDAMTQVMKKEVKPSDLKGPVFGGISEGDREYIMLYKDSVFFLYARKGDKWIKRRLDAEKLVEGMQLDEIPAIWEREVHESAVEKYLGLVDRIRKTYGDPEKLKQSEESVEDKTAEEANTPEKTRNREIEEIECVESDDGNSIYSWGITTGYSISPVYMDQVITRIDICLENGNLYEFSCVDVDELVEKFERINNKKFLDTVKHYKELGIKSLVSWREVKCPNGCNEGACIEP